MLLNRTSSASFSCKHYALLWQWIIGYRRGSSKRDRVRVAWLTLKMGFGCVAMHGVTIVYYKENGLRTRTQSMLKITNFPNLQNIEAFQRTKSIFSNITNLVEVQRSKKQILIKGMIKNKKTHNSNFKTTA